MSAPAYGEKGFKEYSLQFRFFAALSWGFLFSLLPAALYFFYSYAIGNQIAGIETLLGFDVPLAIAYFVTDRLAARAYRKGYNEYYRLNPKK